MEVALSVSSSERQLGRMWANAHAHVHVDDFGSAVQAAKTAAEATETAAKEAEKAADENDALESTSKAAVAAWRASQVHKRLQKAREQREPCKAQTCMPVTGVSFERTCHNNLSAASLSGYEHSLT